MLPVLLAQPDRRVLRDRLAQLAIQGQLVRRDLKVMRELLAPLARLVQQELLEPQAPRAQPVPRGHKALSVPQVQQAQPVHRHQQRTRSSLPAPR